VPRRRSGPRFREAESTPQAEISASRTSIGRRWFAKLVPATPQAGAFFRQWRRGGSRLHPAVVQQLERDPRVPAAPGRMSILRDMARNSVPVPLMNFRAGGVL